MANLPPVDPEIEAEIDKLRVQRDQLLKEAKALENKAAGISMAIEILYGKEIENAV